MDSAYDVNYRQVGTRSHGRLLLGQSNSKGQKAQMTSAASIPSKFETILYTGATEADGFGARVTRFQSQVADLPGPGAYHQGSSAESFSDSFSKKGYGNGFVSKTNRWFKAQATGPPVHFPGPGAYEKTDWLGEKKKNDFNEASATSAFREKESAALVAKDEPIPGPGTYEHDKRQRRRGNRVKRYPKDHSKRNAYSAPGMRTGKGFGEYDDRNNITNDANPEGNNSFGSRDIRFKSSVKDEDDITPGADAYNPNKEYTLQNPYLDPKVPSMAFKSETKREGINTGGEDEHKEPGPGHYRMYEADEIRRGELDETGWRQFKTGQLDKFGNPLNRRVPLDNYPGPGKYETNSSSLKIADKYPTSNYQYPGPNGYSDATKKRALNYGRYLRKTSASISASLQQDIVKTSFIKAPGPAYYNPDKIALNEKRSYHLNLHGRFMP